MDNAVKRFLRKSPLVIKVYQSWKKMMVYPLRFTSFRVMNLRNVPLKDFFNKKKISLLKTVSPYTKAGYLRLDNVYTLAMEVEEKKMSGAFVEAGTWKGGCSAIMGAMAERYKSGRKTWYLDSFEGMPETPSDKDTDNPEEIMGDVLRAAQADVEELIFTKLHLPKENNIIVKGWFQDTFPKVKKDIGPIAILRLDADWYEATIYCLRELYDQIVPGGYVIFDDFARWEGCRLAMKEFAAERNINPKFQFIGNYGGRVMYFKK